MMNRRQIEYFVQVAKLGSVSEAARTLHISQPAISKCLAGIETDLGARLFERSPKGLVLTEAGAILLDSAERILAEHAAYASRIEALTAGRTGSLKVGVSPILTSAFMPKVLMAMAERLPALELSVTSDFGIFDKLRAGEIDIALGDIPRKRELAWCESEPLFVPEPHLVVRRSHPLAVRRHVALADLVAERWVWPLADMGPARWLSDLFRADGLQPPGRRIRLHSRAMTATLLMESDLVGLMTDHPACRDATWQQLHCLPVTLPQASWSIAILRRRGTADSREQQIFCEIVRRQADGAAAA